MKKNLLGLSLALLMALGVSAQADVMNSKAKPYHALTKAKITHNAPQVKGSRALLLEENFDYPAGDLLTAHGWAVQGIATPAVSTTATSISYLGYLSSGIGNEVSLVGAGEDVNKVFTSQTTGTVYASFIAKITTATTTGDYFFHFGQTVISTTFKSKVFAKTDASNNLAFGVSYGSNAGTGAVFTPFTYVLGTTYLVVVKYTFVDGTANDIVQLFIDPVLGSTEPLPTLTATDVPSEISEIGSVALRQGAASSAPVLKLDGIRIGTTWDDVAAVAAINPSTPMVEDFEGNFPATGWSLTTGGGDWAQAADVNHTTGGAYSAIYDCYNIEGLEPAYLQTPEMAVTTGDATFSFWCDYFMVGTGTATANLFVDISNDGGTTWTDGTLDYLSGITFDTWTPFTIDLTPNIGQNVMLRFKAISDYGFYDIAIDDVSGPALNLAAHDLGITAITPDNGFVLTGTTAVPHVVVTNFGDSDEATYAVQLTDGLGYNETINATATLASLGNTDITFPAWTPADGNYTLTATVTLTGDANADNDILTTPVAVRYYLCGDIVSQFKTLTGGAVGVETDGTNIYIQNYSSPVFERYDMNGVFVNNFSITAAANIRDLAYDGTYFYGSASSASLFQLNFTPGAEALVSTITAPQAIRAIAYDKDDNTFWGNNGSLEMKEFGKTGTLTGRSFIPSVTIYGAAYDNFSDPANPTIWGSDWSGGVAKLVEWGLDGTTTGRIVDLTSQITGTPDAGGLAIYKEGNTAYLLADFQTTPNTVVKIFLATFIGADITFNVTDGTNPISDAIVNVNGHDYLTSATGSVLVNLTPGTHAYTVSKSGFITGTGNVTVVDGVNQVIPVVLAPQTEFDVTFTLSNNIPIGLEGVAIVVTQGANTFNGTTNVTGEYTFVALPAATYNYTVSLAGYLPKSGAFTVVAENVYVGITLLEDMVLPFNLVVTNGVTDATFTWNTSTGFSDDFESYDDFSLTFDPWILNDVDAGATYGFSGITFPNSAAPMAGIILNPSLTTPPLSTSTHSGSKMIAIFNTTDLLDNDWIIAPKTHIDPNGQVSFFARAFDPVYVAEKFRVFVSTTGTAPANFTAIAPMVTCSDTLWHQYTYSLAAYAGQEVYVGIQCTSADQFILFIDDFNIGQAKSRAFTGYNVYLDNAQVATNIEATTYTFVAPAPGAHTAGVSSVYTTDSTGIVSIDWTFNVGIDAVANNNINIYPNPTKGKISVENVSNANIYITNIMGNIIAAKQNVTGNASFDLSSVAKGIYMVKIVSDNKVITRKVNVIN